MTKKEKIVEYLDQMNNLIEKIGELVICDEVKEEQPFKIISIFRPSDRLEELDKIPRLDDGNIDYWTCAKLLCEKDGGHLATRAELAQLASYIYGQEIGEKDNKCGLTVKQLPEGLTDKFFGYNYWSSEQLSGYVGYAYLRGFYSARTLGDDNYWDNKYNSGQRAVCFGS